MMWIRYNMIRVYFSEVEKKLEEIKWLIKKKTIELKVNLIEVIDIIKALMSKRGNEGEVERW